MFSSMQQKASKGDFIKDLGSQKRSLGLVECVDKRTNMMLVKFPKVGKTQWIMWSNYGHYRIV
jgi:hypothetical protein